VFAGVTGGSLPDLVLSAVFARRSADHPGRCVFHVTQAITAGDSGVIGRKARSKRKQGQTDFWGDMPDGGCDGGTGEWKLPTAQGVSPRRNAGRYRGPCAGRADIDGEAAPVREVGSRLFHVTHPVSSGHSEGSFF